MFDHGYSSYMTHAFPQDELASLSCKGFVSHGNNSLTLIDTLDTLVVMGKYDEFEKQVWWVADNTNFDIDLCVSVFETNIRVLGGLLSAHVLITSSGLPLMKGPRSYTTELLDLAYDLGMRLLPAFDTTTGIPYGTVNLRYGVPDGETRVTCTAGGGTFSIEFGVLSVLTDQPIFMHVARRATLGLWKYRSSYNLIGNHIDTSTGHWVHNGASTGGGADSFYEYLLKAAILFDDDESMELWRESYHAINRWTKVNDWYIEVNYEDPTKWTQVSFSSLQAFWPGVQALYGDLEEAIKNVIEIQALWRIYGVLPENFDLATGKVKPRTSYPLRPELAESFFYLSGAVPDDMWLDFAKEMVQNINTITRVECGFAGVVDVLTQELYDHMDSYFLSETLKYLYLIFDRDSFVKKSPYVFNTEGHLFPVLPQWRQFSQKWKKTFETTEPDFAILGIRQRNQASFKLSWLGDRLIQNVKDLMKSDEPKKQEESESKGKAELKQNVEKASEKTIEKTIEKTVEKASENAVKKAVEKAIEKALEKVEKAEESVEVEQKPKPTSEQPKTFENKVAVEANLSQEQREYVEKMIASLQKSLSEANIGAIRQAQKTYEDSRKRLLEDAQKAELERERLNEQKENMPEEGRDIKEGEVDKTDNEDIQVLREKFQKTKSNRKDTCYPFFDHLSQKGKHLLNLRQYLRMEYCYTILDQLFMKNEGEEKIPVVCLKYVPLFMKSMGLSESGWIVDENEDEDEDDESESEGESEGEYEKNKQY
eukprot:TRINITY_DN2708_c0_g1_i1.p1 TRINITY_DN2708_c0_g1~~TRINITY_DN2708_c0_g1_i1.p1  ORF type:complete len:766 (-),score=146.81 TRINITY_DN2708_c0_g1_i1:34-2331(-)